MITLYALTNRTLSRLDDLTGRTEETLAYTRAEVEHYLRDGYNLMCRLTRCLFDVHYIENLPAVGNWSSEEEYALALQIPNLILAGKRNFTKESDRKFAPAGSVGPASLTAYTDIPLLSLITDLETTANPTGKLPDGYIEVERVTHDQVTLYPEYHIGLSRYVDARYETQAGDSAWFVIDKDGMFTLRRYPSGDGQADYDDLEGVWGGETYDPDYTGDIVGEWGGLTHSPGDIPIGGPWGAPTRKHPDTNNTRVEIYRLGRNPATYGFEVPSHYTKYIEFWACHRALLRDGPGQDVKLAKHYADRFGIGISRLKKRVYDAQDEYTGRIGHGSQRANISPLTINLPYNYGRSIRRR